MQAIVCAPVATCDASAITEIRIDTYTRISLEADLVRLEGSDVWEVCYLRAPKTPSFTAIEYTSSLI